MLSMLREATYLPPIKKLYRTTRRDGRNGIYIIYYKDIYNKFIFDEDNVENIQLHHQIFSNKNALSFCRRQKRKQNKAHIDD